MKLAITLKHTEDEYILETATAKRTFDLSKDPAIALEEFMGKEFVSGGWSTAVLPDGDLVIILNDVEGK